MVALGAAPPGPLLARPGEPRESGLDRGVTDVTTSSIEAYRYYAEGINFHERSLSAQAAPLLERAIEVDPEFAMAHAKLAVVSSNLGLFNKRDEYAQRALSMIDRLTTRERYYIEGFYYGLRPETIERSIVAYKQGLALHPEHQASRHNLGLHYLFLERYAESIEQYEELLRRGTSNPSTYQNLAGAYIGTGNIGRARELMAEFVQRYPENAVGLEGHAETLVADGQLDEGRYLFEKSDSLNPLDFVARLGRRNVALLQHRWVDAESATKELVDAASPFQRFVGLIGAGHISIARGQSRRALEHWDRAARIPGVAPFNRAAARNRQAMMLLRNGKPAAALTQAELAAIDARNRDQEFETLQLLATAQAALGRSADSAKSLAVLEERARRLPSQREQRRVHWAQGEIALIRGDTGTAVSELTKALSTLPVHGPVTGPPSSHADLWFAAASVNIRAGRDTEAAQLLERLQSAYERVFGMEAYARSFFLLGQIYERRGDVARARQQYARFLDLWRDGDLERAWVAEAQKKLSQ
ncbi:MAG: tetratricopeptide repeat protein [Acidobacteria bacterium]|nr:tetratricopeptide repeat protein [Acidobacteriota bacterium]